MTLIKGGVLGGLVLFIWSAISWMVLPWHGITLHHFKDEKAVVRTIQANAEKPGMYFLPSEQFKPDQNSEHKTLMFSSIKFDPTPSMETHMGIGLLTQIFAAFLVTWLLTKTSGLGYFSRVGFVLVVAFTAALLVYIPYWNWFGFDTSYILVQVTDLLIGWLLAAYVIAAFT